MPRASQSTWAEADVEDVIALMRMNYKRVVPKNGQPEHAAA
jgi:hypothetical protein